MSQRDMTVYEHIGELQKRLMFVVVFFLLAVVVSFFLAEPLIRYLQHADEAKELTMNAFRITDPLKIYMEMIMFIALIMTSPLILFQVWSFVSPGLYERERKVTLKLYSSFPYPFLRWIVIFLFYFVSIYREIHDGLINESKYRTSDWNKRIFSFLIPDHDSFWLSLSVTRSHAFSYTVRYRHTDDDGKDEESGLLYLIGHCCPYHATRHCVPSNGDGTAVHTI